MSRATINAMCSVFPGAEDTDPWGDGHDAWKVGGKMFACMGASDEGVSVKTDSVETATMLIDAGVGRKARYFHRSWINLPFRLCGRPAVAAPRRFLPHRALRTSGPGAGGTSA